MEIEEKAIDKAIVAEWLGKACKDATKLHGLLGNMVIDLLQPNDVPLKAFTCHLISQLDIWCRLIEDNSSDEYEPFDWLIKSKDSDSGAESER